VRQPDGAFLADARASLEDVTATLGAEFDVGDAAEEVDTLGGYLFMKIGRVPVRGELVPGPGDFEIEVYDADPRRLKRLRIYRKNSSVPDRDGRRRVARPDPSRPPAETPPPGTDTVAGDASPPGGPH
jgi:CBS domain containing-hemolysin-like protein